MESERSRNATEAAQPARWGYLIALIGSVGFVVGCFLPFYGPELSLDGGSVSLYEVTVETSSTAGPTDSVAGLVYLFAGAVIVAGLGLAGALGRRERWIPAALIAALATWGLTWAGALLAAGWEAAEFGYTVMLAAIGVAFLGGVLVLVSRRRPRS